jgi:hypothetical protein
VLGQESGQQIRGLPLVFGAPLEPGYLAVPPCGKTRDTIW